MTDVIEQNPFNKPWARQKVWKRRTTPSYTEIVSMINNCYDNSEH